MIWLPGCLTWSTHDRKARKTHIRLGVAEDVLCCAGFRYGLLFNDGDYESLEDLVKRVGETDADKLVCRTCLRIARQKVRKGPFPRVSL